MYTKRTRMGGVGGAVVAVTMGLLYAAGPTQAGTVIEVLPPAANTSSEPAKTLNPQWHAWLVEQGFSVSRCGFDPARGTLALDIQDEAQLDLLAGAGFVILGELESHLWDGEGRTDSQYYDPDEILALLDQTAADHPGITHVFTIGTTYEGRPIRAIEISNNPGVAEDEPAIQFNGQHHAREVATSHVVVGVIKALTDGYGIDPEITAWVNNYKTVCVPMVNPDGVQYVFDSDPWWRKNRQFYPPSCTGVDLNRNYPYWWGPAGCGSSSACSSITYRGPSAASELETQAMMDLADAYHFVMATSYHSYGRFIDYPYACSDGSPGDIMPEHAVIDEMMHGVRDGILAVDGVNYTVYSPASAGPLSGDDTSWYYAYMGTYSFIIETGTSFEPPFSQVAGIVNRNRGGWEYMYRRLGQARIDVQVTDACTGAPAEAEVTLLDYVFDTGELPRVTFLPFGRWTFLVPPNDTYTVRVSQAGYVTQDVVVPVGNIPATVPVALQPTTPPAYGDADCDGDVDLADFAVLADCLAGPGVTPSPTPPTTAQHCLDTFDGEADGDVDLADFAAFTVAFTG